MHDAKCTSGPLVRDTLLKSTTIIITSSTVTHIKNLPNKVTWDPHSNILPDPVEDTHVSAGERLR